MKAECIQAISIPNLCSRKRGVVSFMPRPHYPRWRSPLESNTTLWSFIPQSRNNTGSSIAAYLSKEIKIYINKTWFDVFEICVKISWRKGETLPSSRSTWDLWWAKWQGTDTSPNTLVFLWVSFHQYRTLILSFSTGGK